LNQFGSIFQLSGWVIVGECISVVVFLCVCGYNMREQRVCIKCCFNLGKTTAETHQMLRQTFGDSTLGHTQTYDWHKRLKNGQTSTDDDDLLGWPSTGITPENVSES
jgi:hypothetical protein